MSDFLNKNGGIVTLAKASVVPIGLYAFSKYKDYDSKKTMKVTIIGSLVILGAIVINELSGFGSQSNKFSNRLLYALNIKKQSIKNITNSSAGVLVGNKPIDPRKSECIKQGRNWDEVEKFCGLSINPLPIQNTPNNNKPCKKWIQPTCFTAPCPPTCVEY